jgi:hypothetical protein
VTGKGKENTRKRHNVQDFVLDRKSQVCYNHSQRKMGPLQGLEDDIKPDKKAGNYEFSLS